MKVIQWRKSPIIQKTRDWLVMLDLTLATFTHTNIETVTVNPANFGGALTSLGAD